MSYKLYTLGVEFDRVCWGWEQEMAVFFKVKGSECFWEKCRGEWWWWCGVMGFSGEMEVVGVGENLGVEKTAARRERERERERLLAVKP